MKNVLSKKLKTSKKKEKTKAKFAKVHSGENNKLFAT